MTLSLIILIIAIVLLIWSTDIMINGAIALSQALGVPIIIIGLLLGVGTSFPELAVSVVAALHSSPGLGVANALGSNIVNISLALGSGAVLASISLGKKASIINSFLLIGATSILGLMMWDYYLSRLDGIFLLLLLLPFLYFVSKSSSEENLPKVHNKPLARSYLKVFGGLILLIGASHFTVTSAVNIAHLLNIDETIIGLSVIAIGTSLPELLTVIVSLWKKQPDIAIGDILGSNIFNALGVVGATVAVSPLQLNSELFSRDYTVGALLTLFLFLLLFIKPKFIISRWKGIILLICFGSYMLKLYNDTFTPI